MKKFIVPQYSEYTDMEWRIWIVPADIIVEITKKGLINLLISKIWYNNCWETWYTGINFDDWTFINVKINDILFNPEKLEVPNNATCSLQDVYLDVGTKVILDLWDWTWYQWHLKSVMCPEIKLDYKEIVQLREWCPLNPLNNCRIRQDDGKILLTKISDLRLVN